METTIDLPADLKAKAEDKAKALGMSLADFVRESVERAVARHPLDDPLFSDEAVYRDEAPKDLSSNHDDYLYGHKA